MAEFFAGVVCGYALALVFTPFGTLALTRARVDSPTVARMMPEGTSLVAFSVILHGFWFLGFTAAGMLLGLILNGLEARRPDGGLGSPNVTFTALTIGIVAIAVLPLAVVAPRWRTFFIASGAVFAVTFGWVMPWLATLGE